MPKRKYLKTADTQVINITGTNGKTTTSKIIERVLLQNIYKVGLASTVGIFINGERKTSHDSSGPLSFKKLCKKSASLNYIICENVLRHIKKSIFCEMLSDFTIITNVSNDHLHQTKNGTVEEAARIKERLISRTKPEGLVILNWDNEYTKRMAKRHSDKKLVLFTTQKRELKGMNNINPYQVYYYDRNRIYQRENKKAEVIISDVSSIPLTFNLKLKYNIYNILATLGVLCNSQLENSSIEESIKSMDLNYASIPGRFNILQEKPFRVIFDNAHNPVSCEKTLRIVKETTKGRLISVIKISSTRTDNLIKKLINSANSHSDIFFMYDPSSKRKNARTKEEIRKLSQDVLGKEQEILLVKNEKTALEKALNECRELDTLLFFSYSIDDTHNLLKEKLKLNSLQTPSNDI